MPVRRIEATRVPSPYGTEHGFDRVDRVTDTIDTLYRRRQISTLQKDAAEKYAKACEILAGAGVLTCALASSGVRVAPASRTPLPITLAAVKQLRQAADVLGLIDGAIVHMVVADGLTIREAARRITRSSNPSEREVEVTGARLRSGLTVLAGLWWPAHTTYFRAHRAPDARPLTTVLTEVLPAAIRAVHCSRAGIFPAPASTGLA